MPSGKRHGKKLLQKYTIFTRNGIKKNAKFFGKPFSYPLVNSIRKFYLYVASYGINRDLPQV